MLSNRIVYCMMVPHRNEDWNAQDIGQRVLHSHQRILWSPLPNELQFFLFFTYAHKPKFIFRKFTHFRSIEICKCLHLNIMLLMLLVRRNNTTKKQRKKRHLGKRDGGLPLLYICWLRKQKAFWKIAAAYLARQLDLFIKMHLVV